MGRVSEMFQITFVDIIISTLVCHWMDLVNLLSATYLIPNDEFKLTFLFRFGLGSLVYIRVQQFAIIIDFST